jgi:hypothetical protein
MAADIHPIIVEEVPRSRRYARALTRDIRPRLYTILAKMGRSLAANTRWNTWKSMVAPLMIVAVVTTTLGLVADEFGATVSSRWSQRDNPTVILRLLFRN